MLKTHKFTEENIRQISQAVESVEDKISGEVVPVYLEQSDTYDIAAFYGMLIGAVAAAAVIIFIKYFLPFDSVSDPDYTLFYVGICAAIGWTLTKYISQVRRLMIPKALRKKMTRLRAESLFLNEQAFNTRERTGIMIFLSSFERELIIMADVGINARVDQTVWDSLVRQCIQKIKEKNITAGLIYAVEQCGEILIKHKFAKASDDKNELPDGLRQR